jgi:hypothetical protein
VCDLDTTGTPAIFVYYESRKREVKTRPIYECRCVLLSDVVYIVYDESRKRDLKTRPI